jgi:hypothetical protein
VASAVAIAHYKIEPRNAVGSASGTTKRIGSRIKPRLFALGAPGCFSRQKSATIVSGLPASAEAFQNVALRLSL